MVVGFAVVAVITANVVVDAVHVCFAVEEFCSNHFLCLLLLLLLLVFVSATAAVVVVTVIDDSIA